MKTAAYTICKNEVQYVKKWLYYTRNFTYRAILDTGSTDGTYEALLKAQETDSNLILEQKTFTPWKFDVARRYNLDMIPQDVDWCLSPDMDEYFSINVLKEMHKTIQLHPNVTNIACDRLDIYSEEVRVGRPKYIGTNKIHRRHDYTWRQPIYEYIAWKHEDRPEVEIYNEDIYLVHDQDFEKQSRPELYLKMLREEYEENPSNCWTLWFLVNLYYKERDMNNFIQTACDYVRYTPDQQRKIQVARELSIIYNNADITEDQKRNISDALKI
jgi:glycosyltransferase involved in cell wall biosynthesis